MNIEQIITLTVHCFANLLKETFLFLGEWRKCWYGKPQTGSTTF